MVHEGQVLVQCDVHAHTGKLVHGLPQRGSPGHRAAV